MEFFYRPYRQIAQIALGNSMCTNIPITVSNSIKYALHFLCVCLFSSFADVVPYPLSECVCQYQFISNFFFRVEFTNTIFFLFFLRCSIHHSSELAILGIWSFKPISYATVYNQSACDRDYNPPHDLWFPQNKCSREGSDKSQQNMSANERKQTEIENNQL